MTGLYSKAPQISKIFSIVLAFSVSYCGVRVQVGNEFSFYLLSYCLSEEILS